MLTFCTAKVQYTHCMCKRYDMPEGTPWMLRTRVYGWPALPFAGILLPRHPSITRTTRSVAYVGRAQPGRKRFSFCINNVLRHSALC